MAAKRYTRAQVIKLMRDRQGALTNAEFASSLGIWPSHLRMIYRGAADIGPKVLRALGLEKETLYRAA